MAGVRPQPRGPGSYQIPIVWFIGAVVLWIVSTVLLVVLYTDQARINDEIKMVKDQNRRLLREDERAALGRYINRQGDRSLLGLLESERAATTALLTGDGGLDYPAAAKAFQDVLNQFVSEGRLEAAADFRNASAVQALGNLYQAFTAQQDEARRLTEANRALQQERDQLQQTLAGERQAIQDKADELAGQIAGLQQDYERFRADRDALVADLRSSESQLREQASQTERQHAEALAQLQTRNDRLLTMIERLRDQLARLSPEADPELLLKQADGQILEVNMGEGLAYINLGSEDRLKRGMTFAVYPADGRLPESGEGKGTLEVVKIYPETAECRITASRPGDPILPGEYIGNVVFDRKRSFRFRVIGRFDLDYDGQFDPRGAETIEAMINQWGGTVVDTVDERTDFLVIGGAPPPPPRVSGTPTSAEQTLADQAAAALADFQNVSTEARALSIPLLTQTQFLNLVGFQYTFQLVSG